VSLVSDCFLVESWLLFAPLFSIHVGWNRPLECTLASVDLESFCNLLNDHNGLVTPDAGSTSEENGMFVYLTSI
jgi:hypothetical protein